MSNFALKFAVRPLRTLSAASSINPFKKPVSATRSVYKVLRSILFTAVLVVIGIFAALYIALSVPAVQTAVRERAERELSSLLGGRVDIAGVDIMPFNEVRLHEVSIHTPSGDRCISAARIGAGISLWQLMTTGDLEFTYAEIISLDARLSQASEGAPLNIDFIIRALQPKDRNKPPSRLKIALRNIVIRKSDISFDRLYKPAPSDLSGFDPAHIEMHDFRADVAIPLIEGDRFIIDLRRLAFEERSGLSVSGLSFIADISPRDISVRNFRLRLGESSIAISDQSVSMHGYGDIVNRLKEGDRYLSVVADPIVPSELSPFLPQLGNFGSPWFLTLDLSGNLSSLCVNTLDIRNQSGTLKFNMSGHADNVTDPHGMRGELERLALDADNDFIKKTVSLFTDVDEKKQRLIECAGDVSLACAGSFDLGNRKARIAADVSTGCVGLTALGDIAWNDMLRLNTAFSAEASAIDLRELTQSPRIGSAAIQAEGHVNIAGKEINGDISGSIPFFEFNANRFSGINFEAQKSGATFAGSLNVDDPVVALQANAGCSLAGAASTWNLDAEVTRFFPAVLGLKAFKSGDSLSGAAHVEATGNDIDNFTGDVSLRDIVYSSAKRLDIEKLSISADIDGDRRKYDIESDFINGSLQGTVSPRSVFRLCRGLISRTVPALITPDIPRARTSSAGTATLSLTLMPDEDLYSFLNTPVRPGTPVTLEAELNGDTPALELFINAPYLIKGKDKLIKQSSISLCLAHDRPATASVKTIFPVKNDYAAIDLGLSAADNRTNADLRWQAVNVPSNKGHVALSAELSRNDLDRSIEVCAGIGKSEFSLNGSEWTISPASVRYADKSIDVENLHISHGVQYVDIRGTASADPLDILTADLAGIDLEYIFNVLNINYVDFGGIATGKAYASSLFSRSPVARTDGLSVKNFAYSGCVLGDAVLDGHWDNDRKMIAINADITAPENTGAIVRGGVFLGRDSLSFDFDANKIDIAFLHPFVNGFTSSMRGKASGHIKLFGTFSDLDLAGRAFADTISLKIDQTNVTYSGSDSIIFTHGRISIPGMRLYDRYGNSCRLRGEVTHDYLHDARFNFNVTDIRKMLVYDTGPKMNPQWYGKVFGTGSAALRGVPGLITVDLNMATEDKTEFTLVLDETETAVDYAFLTFSDRRREEREALEALKVEETLEDKLQKKTVENVMERPDLFVLNLSLDISPGAKLVIVMDPKAGDRITAYGTGAMQMSYNSDSDDFSIYGKYTLARGDYNFSLQDLILKNFRIREGSSISFNGDPLAGILDITAAYRVNTNLADLDRSFSSDPDLNRTSVPVDALLRVTGDIHAPEINFDLSLPTVTSDVERKVRSIISTEDMMNRQVIYLLALNRFYSPEYTGGEQGGEWASVASSTISSQIQNIVGSLTDKFSLAPSFKSEKSDLSDMEVDVALSSSLFDNRLLINGNLGYRDKSTSQTTFVGDFDLEYLLSRDGKLRLKAYNHFNDASYYLKSALTTQGIGIIYRKDFDDPLTFIKRMFRRKKKPRPEAAETKEKTDPK